MPSPARPDSAHAPATLVLDEATARRVVLVQAIETSDPDGRLLGLSERDGLEQSALQASREHAHNAAPDPARYLQERASRFLEIVGHRNPRLAALQEPAAWRGRVAWALPGLAFLAGAALDRIEDPSRVDMLSPALLAFVLWNVAVYVLLMAGPWLPAGWREVGPLADLRRALGIAPPTVRPSDGLHRAASTQFRLRWWQAAGRLESWRLRQLMHACAATWALGIAVSIAVGGLVRQYQVGWESTWLDAPQVHALLRALFAPVTALFQLEPVTLAELERMHFRSGHRPGAEDARRWVLLYLALLAIVVMLPRAVLSLHAAWRKRRLRRAVALDLRDPYFAAVLARVSPVRATFALLAPDATGRELLLQALRQAGERPGRAPPVRGVPWSFLESSRGDEWQLVDVADLASSPHGADAVLAVVSSKEEAGRALVAIRTAGKPAVFLLRGEATVPSELPEAADGCAPLKSLPLAECCRCWLLEPPLHDALASVLPPPMAPGIERLVRAWRETQQRRWQDAMRALAEPLAHAARDSEQAAVGPLSLRRLLSPAEREAGQRAREAAMAAVLQRLDDVLTRGFDELQHLHGLPPSARDDLRPADAFVIREALHAGQTSVAGAAGGAAAMGLAVDLMAGGITLGAGALLGALIGGTSALAAAAWKNRDAPNGAPVVQLSDEMLQTLTDVVILRYLAVIHEGRVVPSDRAALAPAWKSEVVAAVAADREAHAAAWSQARRAADPAEPRDAIARALEATTGRVLARLYGVAPAPGATPRS